MKEPPKPPRRISNTSLALSLAAVVAGMVMLAYASVPLYRLFCQVTGFGGTPIHVEQGSIDVVDYPLTIRFNADIDPSLPWEFRPGEQEIKVKLGENKLTYYHAKNTADKAVTGHALYNVLPEKAAPYFAKIECFCFTNQTLQAGEEVLMPISFFIDPQLLEDESMKDVSTITLSYTFFPAKSDASTP